jgi:hypothetical protein
VIRRTAKRQRLTPRESATLAALQRKRDCLADVVQFLQRLTERSLAAQKTAGKKERRDDR